MSVSTVDRTESRLARFLASKNFEYAITGLILFNAVLLGLETFPAVSKAIGRELDLLNDIILGIFVVELTLRVVAFGRGFWREGWSWFDMIVVGVGLLPFAEGFSALRALRVIRLLRFVSVVPSLRRVVEGLVRALPGLGSIVILLLVLIYVFSVMATKLFAATNPELFGSLGASAFSLFTVMTLEGWPDLARSVMEQHPWAWLFFIVFILMSSWAVLNLFIGVIVEAMQSPARESKEPSIGSDAVLAELRSLRQDVQRLTGPSSGNRQG
jgi:voltage-gated sodium channel